MTVLSSLKVVLFCGLLLTYECTRYVNTSTARRAVCASVHTRCSIAAMLLVEVFQLVVCLTPDTTISFHEGALVRRS